MEKARAVLPEVTYCSTVCEAVRDAEAVVIATEWDEFRNLDWDQVRQSVARPLIVDGRNILDPEEMASRGFNYFCVGKQPAFAAPTDENVVSPLELSEVSN
jgi:UDPglucose 6-dehydrogenase